MLKDPRREAFSFSCMPVVVTVLVKLEWYDSTVGGKFSHRGKGVRSFTSVIL
jgi:hypothetical protein